MNFPEAVTITLTEEGPISWDTVDGLPTKWGIRAKFYPQVMKDSFTQADAIKIYKSDYWDAVKADQFPEKLRLMLFECAVNQGPQKATLLMQEALNVKPDGVIGPITLAAAHKASDAALDEFTVRRIWTYARIPAFGIYGTGWMRRLVRDYRKSLQETA